MGEEKVVKIGCANSRLEAEMIIDILGQNKIPAYRQGIGSAQILDIYAGNSDFGEEIFVNQKDAERAKDLVSNILQQEEQN